MIGDEQAESLTRGPGANDRNDHSSQTKTGNAPFDIFGITGLSKVTPSIRRLKSCPQY